MRTATRPSGERERGFTLIELLVSVLVLSIGLLALTGASAVVARQIAGGARMTLAASIAESRFERLRAQDCMMLAGGASSSRGIEERWTITRHAGALGISDSVTMSLRRGERVYVFEALLPCAGVTP